MSLPEKPGVYIFRDEKDEIQYVGKAINLKSRVSSYFTSKGLLGEKTRQLVSHIHTITTTEVESELESLLLEAFYIKKYRPKYNIRMTDNKSYPLIRITQKDTYPAVVLARKMDDPKSLYFGPYPNSSAVKLVLKTIRRVFPFISTLNHPKRICLYNHLGLCPCLPVKDTPENRKAYQKNIRQIIRILEGESRTIMKELEKEREMLSKDEKYEEALILQKRIQALSYITQPFHRPFEYHVNPNLREDIRQQELAELTSILQKVGYTIPYISKIECYDISHIQGTNTTASLVVFVNGEKEGSLYRKFKIRLKKTPDDFASMREVLTRRLKHDEWELPELFVIDGGKGQVSSALEVFNELGITIPIIGLAKRLETIVIPMKHSGIQKNGEKESFKEILLPRDSKALQLIMRIRDEAHRFAITYHRKLRSKAALA